MIQTITVTFTAFTGEEVEEILAVIEKMKQDPKVSRTLVAPSINEVEVQSTKSPVTEPEAPASQGTKAEAPSAKEKKAPKAPKKEVKEAPTATIEMVRKAISRMIDVLGEEEGATQGRALLRKFEARKIPDIDPKFYQAVLDKAEAIIREAEAAVSEGGDDEGDILGLGEDGESEESFE